MSNWYIRRNRPRFWDPRGKDETSKLAAYQTLHEVFTTLVRLLAPVIPFLTERIYQNLSGTLSENRLAESVHLCDYPQVNPDLEDQTLSVQMAVVKQVAGTGRALREQASRRVRQPLKQIKVAVSSEQQRQALERLEPLLLDELNIKSLAVVGTLGNLTTVTAKPNFAKLGPKYAGQAKSAAQAIASSTPEQATMLQKGEAISLQADGQTFEVSAEDVHIHVETKPGWAIGESGNLQIALDIRITPELEKEGLARDVVRHIQQLRKEIGLNIEDHIECAYKTDDAPLSEAIEEWKEYIMSETQADTLMEGSIGLTTHEIEIGPYRLDIEMMLHTGG